MMDAPICNRSPYVVIRREEQYLERKFDVQYLDYN